MVNQSIVFETKLLEREQKNSQFRLVMSQNIDDQQLNEIQVKLFRNNILQVSGRVLVGSGKAIIENMIEQLRTGNATSFESVRYVWPKDTTRKEKFWFESDRLVSIIPYPEDFSLDDVARNEHLEMLDIRI